MPPRGKTGKTRATPTPAPDRHAERTARLETRAHRELQRLQQLNIQYRRHVHSLKERNYALQMALQAAKTRYSRLETEFHAFLEEDHAWCEEILRLNQPS
jgi:FtsZ-binding cell division protein ZapB